METTSSCGQHLGLGRALLRACSAESSTKEIAALTVEMLAMWVVKVKVARWKQLGRQSCHALTKIP